MTFPNLADLLTLTPHHHPHLPRPPPILPSLGCSQNNNSTHFVMHMHMHISIYLCTHPHIGSVAPLGTPETGGSHQHSARLSRPVVCKPHRQPPTPSLSCGQCHCFRISQGSHPFTPQLEPVSSRAGRPACLPADVLLSVHSGPFLDHHQHQHHHCQRHCNCNCDDLTFRNPASGCELIGSASLLVME